MKLVDVLRDKIEKAEEDIRVIDDRVGKALGYMVELEDEVVQKQTELDRVETQIGQLSRQNQQLDERIERLRLAMEAKGAERLVQSAELRLESFPTVVESEVIEEQDEDDVLTLDAVANDDEDEDEDAPKATPAPAEAAKRRNAVQSAFRGLSRNH